VNHALPQEQTLDFRPMHMDDLAAVLRNETRAYAYPWSPGIFADCLAARYDCWVARAGERIVGHGVLSIVAGEAHILNVCIARDHQGRGWGRALAEHLLARARRRGADMVFLEVRPSNRVAIRLYDSLGFNEIGVRPRYYPAAEGYEDAQVRALQLF